MNLWESLSFKPLMSSNIEFIFPVYTVIMQYIKYVRFCFMSLNIENNKVFSNLKKQITFKKSQTGRWQLVRNFAPRAHLHV